jgi:hypothetical protein
MLAVFDGMQLASVLELRSKTMWHSTSSDRGLFDRQYDGARQIPPELLPSESEPPRSTRPVSSHVWLEDFETRPRGTGLIVALAAVAVLLAGAAFASMWRTPKLGKTETVPIERTMLTDGSEFSRLHAIQIHAKVDPPVALPKPGISTAPSANQAASANRAAPSAATPAPASTSERPTTTPSPTPPPAMPEYDYSEPKSGTPNGELNPGVPPGEPRSDNPY